MCRFVLLLCWWTADKVLASAAAYFAKLNVVAAFSVSGAVVDVRVDGGRAFMFVFPRIWPGGNIKVRKWWVAGKK